MSTKFIHELPALTDVQPDDALIVSRNDVEYQIPRYVFMGSPGTTLDLAITAPIAVPAGGLVPIAGAGLDGANDYAPGVFDLDTGLFTAPFDGIFCLELEVYATSVTASGAGPLSLQGLANGGDLLIASQVIPAGYGTSGANTLWQGRFSAIAFLDAEQDFYFGVNRQGAPAASITSGRIRIIKLV